MTISPSKEKELASKNTLSVPVGTEAPPAPPLVVDQWAVSFHSPPFPLQYLLAMAMSFLSVYFK